MSCCLKSGVSVSGSSEIMAKNRGRELLLPLEIGKSLPKGVLGRNFNVSDQKLVSSYNIKSPQMDLVNAQPSVCVSKALRWWEKFLQPNMVEIQSAQELVDSLLSAGDKLVILDFYSPGCGGCKTLHPKICQLAEKNPGAVFMKINYERNKAMCYALHVHVLPFFRFYRGAEGKVGSFSCTNATIKKFKDALAKHGNDRCSLGPTKGLDESEVFALASIGLLSGGSGLSSTNDNDKRKDLVVDENELCKQGSAMVMAFS
ncbi:Thioredoxin-like 1-1- chloroplastic [Striga hermonthica]|uniref:Thioredoxin-like 1-1- chloroplastic n=1 Tax=Striga hermonthica TaxID=68872 RepID=A0A9N7RBY6_STRHE|nr:Thioredoxin-like 1-1- chloroplastic [Striga hermonthica]